MKMQKIFMVDVDVVQALKGYHTNMSAMVNDLLRKHIKVLEAQKNNQDLEDKRKAEEEERKITDLMKGHKWTREFAVKALELQKGKEKKDEML